MFLRQKKIRREMNNLNYNSNQYMEISDVIEKNAEFEFCGYQTFIEYLYTRYFNFSILSNKKICLGL